MLPEIERLKKKRESLREHVKDSTKIGSKVAENVQFGAGAENCTATVYGVPEGNVKRERFLFN